MIVCICNNISDRDIAREVAGGCPSFGQLQMRTGIAAGCGSCHDCAKEAFVEHRQRCTQRAAATSSVSGLLPLSHVGA